MTKLPRTANSEPTPEEYRAFIEGIELRSIWLSSIDLENNHGPDTPEQAVFHFDDSSQWEGTAAGFRAYHTYVIRLAAQSSDYAQFRCTFGLDFQSEHELTDEIFSVFREANLPVNTWPYLRELLSNMMGRMQWVPFTLPTLKRGISQR